MLIGIIKMPKIKKTRSLKMNRPLITHDDNYGTDYHYDNKKDKTRFDTNPIRWNEIWYNNEERSSI